MRNNSLQLLLVLIALSLTVSCGRGNRNSESVTELLNEYPQEIKGLYFYPSTIRMLGKLMGDEGGEAFKNINSGRFLYTWNGQGFDLSSHFDDVIVDSRSHGFEMLAEMDNADGKNAIYLKDDGSPIYLLFLENSFGDYIVELTGEISLQSIYELSTLDYSSVISNFPAVSVSTDSISEPNQDEMTE